MTTLTNRGGEMQFPPIHVTGPSKHANLWLICWLVFYDKHADRGGTSVDWVLLGWQRPGFKPIWCTNRQSRQWPFPRKATTRTVHCLKQGACLQSDITIAAAAGSFSCSSPQTTSSHCFLVFKKKTGGHGCLKIIPLRGWYTKGY